MGAVSDCIFNGLEVIMVWVESTGLQKRLEKELRWSGLVSFLHVH